jgi:N-acyl-D-amino-acid deacylase
VQKCIIGVLLLLLSNPAIAEKARLLIRGGTVIDGTGGPAKRADVRIIGGRIAAIGALTARPGEPVLDATSRYVVPGFIDTHSHADSEILEFPEAETQIRQGICTAVAGQDGSSRYPLAPFFAKLATKHSTLNLASFVGHGTIRSRVMGQNYKKPASLQQIVKMCLLMEEEMRAGALGLSSGLEYDPGAYSKTAELVALAKVAAAHHGLYISHVRDEGDRTLEAFAELIQIARAAKLPAQISHIKLGTSAVWGKTAQVLEMIANARRVDLDITADLYPYIYWQSTITVLTPNRNWEDRANWVKALADVGGPGHVLLSSFGPDPSWAGKTIEELAKITHKDPVSIIQDIVHRTQPPGRAGDDAESVIVTAMQEADMRTFMAAPVVMFCTDGSIKGTHPRGAGSFPRILGRYVRQEKVLTWEQAIHKATQMPAERMGLADRGVLRPGNWADVASCSATPGGRVRGSYGSARRRRASGTSTSMDSLPASQPSMVRLK